MVYDDKSGQAFVLTRFDNGISVVDVDERKETEHLTMFNPEPQHIVEVRPFLYSASGSFTQCNSSHSLNPSGNAGMTDHPGFLGCDGRITFENLPMVFKVVHFRNMYQ